MDSTDAVWHDAARKLDDLMAHAWMVRTFVKHSEEVEQFPELMQVVRAIFDIARALETRRGDPVGRLAMLKKKLPKLRRAAEQFRRDAPLASIHENYRQAVRSLDACIAGLEALVASVFPPKAAPGMSAAEMS
jgi:hypothetical protein